MESATINRIASRLALAFSELGYKVPLSKIEELSFVILRAMTGKLRVFHDFQHIFDVAKSDGPHETIGALFHDVVYHGLDRGFPPVIRVVLDPYIREEDAKIFVKEGVPWADHAFWMCVNVFGHKPGAEVPASSGLNEFLSALVCSHHITKLILPKDVLKILACIEATCPFRLVPEGQPTAIEKLSLRAVAVAAEYEIPLSAGEINLMNEAAVTLANNDVANFGFSDPGEFLSYTWRLIPEMNIALHFPKMYSIKDYRGTLQKVHGFFSFLKPEAVFQRYGNVPPEEKFQALRDSARRNLSLGKKYLELVLSSVSLLEALALTTGGDAPIALFLGDVQPDGRRCPKVNAFLKKGPPVALPSTHDEVLYQIVNDGRTLLQEQDSKDSVLAAYLYPRMSVESIDAAFASAKLFFEGKKTAEEHLKVFPKEVTKAIAHACAEIAVTRAPLLLAL